MQQMDKARGLRIPALKVRQNGHDLYMVDLTADNLLKYTKVDKWKAGASPDAQGYQREELQAHYNKVGRYLVTDKKAILPTSILLSARDGVTFEPQRDGSTMGYLHVPEKSLPLWIVDGQHRVAGLRYAIDDLEDESARNFTLPAIIMANMQKFDEVHQFYIVNSTSQRIKTDLAERLLTEMAERSDTVKASVYRKGKAYLLRAVKIVEMLNNEQGGPWEGRIQQVNKRRVGDVMIAESSFNESLKPILAMSFVLRWSDAEVAKLISRYWSAIFHYMPVAHSTPRSFSLQKTIGTYAWHLVAPAILDICRDDMDFSIEKMVGTLKPTKAFLVESFWEVGGGDAQQYSSRAGFTILSELILKTVPETSPVMIDSVIKPRQDQPIIAIEAQFENDEYIDLEGTGIISATFSGSRFGASNWSEFVRRVHAKALIQLGSIQELKSASTFDLCQGRQKRFAYIEEAGISFRAKSATESWKHILKLARKIEAAVEVTVKWKPNSARPGEIKVLKWPK